MSETIKATLQDIKLLLIEKMSENPLTLQTLLQLMCDNVRIVPDCSSALKELRYFKPAIVVIDLSICDHNRDNFIRTLHQLQDRCAVLAIAKEDLAAVQRLQNVQYVITKPFNHAAMLKGLDTCLEHLSDNGFFEQNKEEGLYFDPYQRRLYLHGENIHLTPKERQLLSLLYQNRQRTVSYTEIENYVWEDQGMSKGSLKSMVNKIRTKVGFSSFIINDSNEGYRLMDDLKIEAE